MTADRALTMLHEVYQGSSADRLAELWSTITKYSKVIVEACHTISKVLRAAALVVEGAKTASIVQLASIQASFAAASSTGPWSSAAVLRLGREIMKQLLNQAVSRLAHTLLQPIEDMIVKAAQQIAPTPSNNSNGQGFSVDLDQVASCAADLRRGADDIESHGLDFKRIVSGLKLGESGDPFGRLAIQIAEKILQTIAEDVLKRILGSFRDTAAKMDKMAGNLSDNEDSNRTSLNSIASLVANPLSPNLATGTGVNSVGSSSHIGGGRGSADAGLAAFAALSPKLGPIGGGGSRGGSSGSGLDMLGLKRPNLGAVGSGSHGGGGGGGGGAGGGSGSGSSGSGEGMAGGFVTRLSTPGGAGAKGGALRLGTNLDNGHDGASGVGGSGSGGSGGTGTSTAGLSGRPPMAGGMMGMPMAGGGYGPVGGGSGIRGAQRRGGQVAGDSAGGSGANGENPADGVIADASSVGAGMHSSLQLGRVAPARKEPGEERAERDDRYDDDFDADLSDLPDFTEFSDPA
ncbi:hypothetical protein ACFYS8_20025 [Kitasatospora sp. NPDC004615]|uniref:hypothetical protein n=1 Tax=Kitasatospora sp. NPDC004615 TaxID=3364017 RepID=UPI0036ABF5DA